jgi:uncharacterized metal-binding protein
MTKRDNCCTPAPRKDSKECCCASGEVNTVLACSGGSNVGQITNEVAKRLDEAGEAKFFCLAGIGGHISGMVASVKGADKVLVLDGCPVACAKNCAEQAGLANYKYLVVTELGIKKEHSFKLSEDDVEKAMRAARLALGKKT